MNEVRAHIIHKEHGMLTRQIISVVPRVGDEIRLSGERYYKVILVVWVFDEPECPMQRVNIGVVEASLDES